MSTIDNRETALLQALFGGDAIPFTAMDVLPEIRLHAAAMIALSDHKTLPLKGGQMLNRNPEISQALNIRVAQLWETPKADGSRRTWPEVAAEVGAGMVASSARNRYQRYQAQLRAQMHKEGYDAISGAAIGGPTPPGVAAEIKTERKLWEKSLKTEPASQEFQAHEHDEPIGDSEQLAPKKNKKVPKIPLSKRDAMILEMAENSAMDSEICIAVQRNFGESFTVMEMRRLVRQLQGAKL